jgi:hypothetical protein
METSLTCPNHKENKEKTKNIKSARRKLKVQPNGRTKK